MRPNAAGWRRSSKCAAGDCVEVLLGEDRVAMRDSKSPEAGVLQFDRDAWIGFVSAVRSGKFDLD
jgi:Domain of unknown function (DUF397)